MNKHTKNLEALSKSLESHSTNPLKGTAFSTSYKDTESESGVEGQPPPPFFKSLRAGREKESDTTKKPLTIPPINITLQKT